MGCLLDYFHIMIFSDIRTNVCPGERRIIMREEYITEILKLLEKCPDIETIDLIYQLLVKKCQNA